MLFNVGEHELFNVLLDGRDCSEAIQNAVTNGVHILRLKICKLSFKFSYQEFSIAQRAFVDGVNFLKLGQIADQCVELDC